MATAFLPTNRRRNGGGMKFKKRTPLVAVAVLIATTITINSSAQNKADNKSQHPRYRLVDLGTLGGGWSFISSGPPLLKILNNQGVVVGDADTSTPDPY